MKGIYKITNILNGKYYVGSSKDVQGRLKSHKSMLKTNKHRNSKLQNAYNKYGADSFTFSMVEKVDKELKKLELLAVEQIYLDIAVKEEVYNLNFTANSGGAEVLKIPCYLLDLDGNILSGFDSISECYKNYLNMSNCSSRINSGMIHLKKYRVVTYDFYENNKELIFSWKNFSKVPPKIIKEKVIPKIYCDFDNEILEFNSIREAAEKIGITSERVRQILHYNRANKYHIRYDKNDILKEKICITINNKHFKFDKISDVGFHTGIPICEIRGFLEGMCKNNSYNIRFLNDEIIESNFFYLKDIDFSIQSKNVVSACGIDSASLITYPI